MLPNGLSLVILPTNNDKSSCYLTVGKGSLGEPIPGIAHLLEHLILISSTKYPENNLFLKKLSLSNGTSNANTNRDTVEYYFDSNNDSFVELLDIFANFFIDPKFEQGTLDDEIDIINTEFMTLKSDTYINENIIGDHFNFPISKWFIGNKTNYGRINKRTLLLDIINYWNNSYSADIMNVVIMTSLQIEEYASTIFSKISNREYTKNSVNYYTVPYEDNYIITTPSIDNLNILSIMWYIKLDDPTVKPLQLFANIINQRHKRSLYSSLNIFYYIKSLTCNVNNIHPYISQFVIMLYLTKKGRSEYLKVISIIKSYIKFLCNEDITETIYIKERHKQKSKYAGTDIQKCKKISENIFRYKEHIIDNSMYNIDTAFIHYQTDIIKLYQKLLLVSKCICILNTKDVEDLYLYKEKYFFHPYNCEIIKIQKYNTEFAFPGNNVYITTPYIHRSPNAIENIIVNKYTNTLNTIFYSHINSNYEYWYISYENMTSNKLYRDLIITSFDYIFDNIFNDYIKAGNHIVIEENPNNTGFSIKLSFNPYIRNIIINRLFDIIDNKPIIDIELSKELLCDYYENLPLIQKHVNLIINNTIENVDDITELSILNYYSNLELMDIYIQSPEVFNDEMLRSIKHKNKIHTQPHIEPFIINSQIIPKAKNDHSYNITTFYPIGNYREKLALTSLLTDIINENIFIDLRVKYKFSYHTYAQTRIFGDTIGVLLHTDYNPELGLSYINILLNKYIKNVKYNITDEQYKSIINKPIQLYINFEYNSIPPSIEWYEMIRGTYDFEYFSSAAKIKKVTPFESVTTDTFNVYTSVQ